MASPVSLAELRNGVQASYDKAADVLYLSLGAPQQADTDEVRPGLLIRYSWRDGRPCGATIIDYRMAHANEPSEIVEIYLETYLGVPRKSIEAAIARAVSAELLEPAADLPG